MMRARFQGLLLALLFATAGCDSGPPPCTAATGSAGQSLKLVLSSITLPVDYTFDFDLDGSGAKNSLHRLILLLTSQGAMPQEAVNDALTAGNLILLLDESASNFDYSPCGTVDLRAGIPSTPPPAFDGQDVFTIDYASPGGAVAGPFVDRGFSSMDPKLLDENVELHFQLPLSEGAPPIPFDLSAAHLQFSSANADGSAIAGQINGAIRYRDLERSFLPRLAEVITAGPTFESLRMMLDLGDGEGHTCTNLDGTKSLPGDGVVGACELVDSPFYGAFFLPDVQLFDANGDYHPTKGGKHPDSMSIGFGFSAVRAQF